MLKACPIIVATGVLLFARPALGVDLRVVASDSTEEISIDVDSIKTIVGSHTELKVLTLYKSPQKLQGVPPFTATAAVVWFRCLSVEGSLATIVFMSSPEKVVLKQELPVDWKRVDMKTDMGLVWKYFCTRAWEREKR
jgi:hypothetical protein